MKKQFRILTGCVLFFFLLSLIPVVPVLAATSATCPAPEGKGITVMSFNVLNNNNKDSNGNFTYAAPATREKQIASMIKAYKPDIIGIQEAGQGGDSGTLNWCSALNTDLKSIYAYRSLKDDTGLALDVYRGLIIFYNKSRFTLVSSGGQGYSDPANSKRAFHWVKLKDNQTNTEFFVFNTHWQYDGNQTLAQNQATRATQATELAKKVNSLAKNQHFFITGDFNSSYVLKNSTTKCDGVNIAKLMTNANYADGLVTAPEKYSVNADGTRTALATSDNSLQTCFDHVVYHDDFYTPTKMEKILVRTYSTKLSDHDAILVHFKYNMPSLTASASEGTLDAFYSNGAYYIDNFDKRITDLPITAKPSNGAIYTDAAGTTSAGTALTIKTGETQTYRPNNTLYLKWGGMVQTLYLRTCNANTMANSVFVDKAFTNKAAGSTSLYCDKWYCRKITVGVNGFTTIQEAVNAAGDGYQVLVAPGTYTEEVSYTGKSLKFYGQNRTNLKALVIKDGQLTVNSSNRTYETYLSGSITYNVGDQAASSIMVNGFHFINRTSTGQVRILGGDANKTVDLRICNNLFNCYTDGSTNNGSAVHGVTSIQKTGSIEDNYFHLTKIPTYTDSSGATKNYTNRGISLRNLKDISIIANYFDGYTGSMMRPFWLSSEVASGSTTPGYGNVAILANRFENCYPGALNINNIRSTSNANVLIGGNSYGGEVMNVTFTDTANQTSQNLPTDKSKITFKVQTADYSSLKITDGPTCTKFSYYVTFRSEDGMYIYGNSAVSGTTATYKGVTPTKAATGSNHYTFAGWVTEKNGTTALNLSNIKATSDAYASFTTTAHTVSVKNEKNATCTESGYSGDRYCTVCNHTISMGTTIAPTGHTEVVDQGSPATCTVEGLTDGKHCTVCNEVLTAQEVIPATGHISVATPAKDPTCTAEGLTEGSYCSVCNEVLTAQEVIPATGHTSVATLAKDPTCTAEGLTEGSYCSVCNEVLTAQEVIPATGHTSVATPAKDPTCTAEGLTEGSYCSVCNEVLTAQEVIPATGHSYSETVTPPTCTADGKIIYTCSVCGHSYEEAGATATGHSYSETVTPSTCTADGKITYTCSVCGHSYEEAGATATGHSYSETVTPPTCTADGKITYTCSVCGHSYEGAGATATGHVYTYTKVDGQTHTVGCEDCDLSDTASHTYENGTCVCGDAEIKEPITDSTILIGHSLNLASDISVNFVAQVSQVKNYVNHRLVVEIPVYTKNEQTGTKTVTIEPVLNGSYYYFTLTGLTAVNMGDVVSAQLHMEKDGQPYVSNVDTYSIAKYAYAQLNKAEASTKLKALCADLLRYGKEAQVYKTYRTDALVDAAMTETHRSYLSDASVVTFGTYNETIDDLANPVVTWLGKALSLDSKVAVKYIFSLGSYTGKVEELSMKVHYVNYKGETVEAVIEGPEAYDVANKRYSFTFDGLLAAELRNIVEVAIYHGETRLSKTMYYAADTYGNNKSGQLLVLCKALFAYSDTAKAYFG